MFFEKQRKEQRKMESAQSQLEGKEKTSRERNMIASKWVKE